MPKWSFSNHDVQSFLGIKAQLQFSSHVFAVQQERKWFSCKFYVNWLVSYETTYEKTNVGTARCDYSETLFSEGRSLSCYVTSLRVMPLLFGSNHVASRHFVSRHFIIRYVTLHYETLHHMILHWSLKKRHLFFMKLNKIYSYWFSWIYFIYKLCMEKQGIYIWDRFNTT